MNLHQIDSTETACCTASSTSTKQEKKHSSHKNHSDHHDHDGHDHSAPVENPLSLFVPAIFSFTFLLLAILFDHFTSVSWFQGWIRILWYIIAYLPVGLPVLKDAWKSIMKGNFFSEFFLMSLATIGAFAIGEFPEAVAVMLFYSIGEGFQTLAVSRATANIKSLLEEQPDEATILVNHQPQKIAAHEVKIGDIIQLKPGEKLALDGELLSEKSTFNTSALTGESTPDLKMKGETVLAGMINLTSNSLVKVTTAYEDSKLSKILELVQNATSQKAPTELFISKFAKVYTPIVVFLAIAITFLPYFFVTPYVFEEWLYKALVFLVISCPCALVISIPLGYFGGIGAGSKNGILFKGSNFLDILADVTHVAMDKTGTLTEGVFEVKEVNINPEFDIDEILHHVNGIESKSTHPIASALQRYVGSDSTISESIHVEEIAGMGLKGIIEDTTYLVGNFKLMNHFQITYDATYRNIAYTTLAIAKNGQFVGYITIADTIKKEAASALRKLHEMGVQTTMLSGDKMAVVEKVAQEIQIHHAYGDLLPEDKVRELQNIKSSAKKVAFVGDGINDAPVVAISDVGIAMGGLGSDATIETADVVIQDDQIEKIPMAIAIGKKTKKIVWQNISMAFVVKGMVLLLGAGGLATMWEAVFADVGVALLAIFNAVRIQKTKF